jgi:hypothetical protein
LAIRNWRKTTFEDCTERIPDDEGTSGVNSLRCWESWQGSRTGYGKDERRMKIVSLNVGLPREVKWHGRLVTTGIFEDRN